MWKLLAQILVKCENLQNDVGMIELKPPKRIMSLPQPGPDLEGLKVEKAKFRHARMSGVKCIYH